MIWTTLFFCKLLQHIREHLRLSDYSSITSHEMELGNTVVNYDSKTDPRTAADYHRAYEANGERAYVAFPLVARRMWPALLIVIILGWIRAITRNANWYSQGFATAVFVLAVLLLLAGLIWWTAVSLNRTDRKRHLADLALRQSEARLTVLIQVSVTEEIGRS